MLCALKFEVKNGGGYGKKKVSMERCLGDYLSNWLCRWL